MTEQEAAQERQSLEEVARAMFSQLEMPAEWWDPFMMGFGFGGREAATRMGLAIEKLFGKPAPRPISDQNQT